MESTIKDQELVSSFNEGRKGKRSIPLGKRGSGSLLVLTNSSGVYFYYSAKEGGKLYEIALGKHHLFLSGNDGLTFDEAVTSAKSIIIERSKKTMIQIKNERWSKKQEEKKSKAIEIEEALSKEAAYTFRDVFVKFISEKIKENKKTGEDYRNRLNRYLLENDLFQQMLNKKAEGVTETDIVEIMTHCYESQSKKITRTYQMLHTHLRKGFANAKAYDRSVKSEPEARRFFIQINPVIDIPVEKLDSKPRASRELTDKEIWLIWHHGVQMMGKVGFLARLLLACGGLRIAQLMRMEWNHVFIDDDHQLIITNAEHDEDSNKGKPCLIPLTRLALEEVEMQRRVSGHCKHVFPKSVGSGLSPDDHMVDTLSHAHRKMEALIKEKCMLPEKRVFQTKFIRSSVTTRMIEAKCDELTVMRIQSHKTKDMKEFLDGVHSRRYNKFEYLEAKIAELQKWEAYLLNIISKPLYEVEDRLPENKSKKLVERLQSLGQY